MAFGPIDLIVLEFKAENFSDAVIASLVDLVSHETIRILDLVIVQKNEQDEVSVQELKELDPTTRALLEPLRAEISGMITASDIQMIGGKLRQGATAAIMLFENLWAVRLRQDVRDGGGRLVMNERIPKEVVTEAIKDLAEYD
jgi:hypothetical protein